MAEYQAPTISEINTYSSIQAELVGLDVVPLGLQEPPNPGSALSALKHMGAAC